MKLAEALLPLLDSKLSACVIAIAGAGGKTTTMFTLAEELRELGHRVILTTTTKILDPRREAKRCFDQVFLDPALGEVVTPEAVARFRSHFAPAGSCIVLASQADPLTGKLHGIHPSWTTEIRKMCDFLLVECDGAKGLPIKAPATYEPVIPFDAALVLGLVGLDCLGKPMDERHVHRSEIFAKLTGCAPGAAIAPEHILALACSEEGLFKSAPAKAQRILILNKADTLESEDVSSLLEFFSKAVPFPAEHLLVCSLQCAEPGGEVRAHLSFPNRFGGNVP